MCSFPDLVDWICKVCKKSSEFSITSWDCIFFNFYISSLALSRAIKLAILWKVQKPLEFMLMEMMHYRFHPTYYLALFTQNSNSTLLHSLVIIPVGETSFSMRGLFFCKIKENVVKNFYLFRSFLAERLQTVHPWADIIFRLHK